MSCCGAQWVGADRAHCCRRTGGCGHVFDDAQLWDAHRVQGICLNPRSRGMVPLPTGSGCGLPTWYPGARRRRRGSEVHPLLPAFEVRAARRVAGGSFPLPPSQNRT